MTKEEIAKIADNTYAMLPVEQITENGHVRSKEMIEAALIRVYDAAIEEVAMGINPKQKFGTPEWDVTEQTLRNSIRSLKLGGKGE